MNHLSPIEIKSTINQEMDWGFISVFSSKREAMKSNESQHSIFERAREKKAQKRSIITKEREILLDLSWNKNRHSESTDNRIHCDGLKNGLQTNRQTKYIFTVWQNLVFQSREHDLQQHDLEIRLICLRETIVIKNADSKGSCTFYCRF